MESVELAIKKSSVGKSSVHVQWNPMLAEAIRYSQNAKKLKAVTREGNPIIKNQSITAIIENLPKS